MQSNKKDKVKAKGGKATLKKYGVKHFSKLAKLSWKNRKIVKI